MRVYYVSSGSFGCYIVRCLLPLMANGWDGDHTSIHPWNKTPENKAQAAQDADIVVFHRPEDARKLELARLLKSQGKKIVMDNDDTYKDTGAVKLNTYFNKERVARGLGDVNKIVDQFIIEADLITTTTEFLADEYRKLNKDVIVLPNCVDPFYFDEPLRNETDVVRIGITGSLGMSHDLDLLDPIIKHYEHDPRVKIVFFSLPANRDSNPISYKAYEHEYNFLDSVDVEWHPLVDADLYYDKINSLKLDIMIIPRADNAFNRAKSNLKFLESSMFEIPCVAQSFPDGKSPYEVNPKDAEHMVLATTPDDFIEKIESLIVDKEKRREIGRKAKEYVIENYDINTKAHLWDEAYEKLLNDDSVS